MLQALMGYDWPVAILALLLACSLGAALSFYLSPKLVREDAHPAAAPQPVPSVPAAPLMAPDPELVKRLVAVEEEVASLRRHHAAFIEDADAILGSIEHKRKTIASAESKRARRERTEEPEALPLDDLRPGPTGGADRLAQLRVVRERLAARGFRA